jgi:hypothetical protein
MADLKNNVRDYAIIYLIAVVILAFLIPQLIYHQPFGSDTYEHIYKTSLLLKHGGLKKFYEKTDGVYNPTFSKYPFGLWYSGAILSKITGLSIKNIAIIVPLLGIISTAAAAILFSKLFLKNTFYSILSAALLLTIPLKSSSSLNYDTKTFVFPLTFFLLYLFFKKGPGFTIRCVLFGIISLFLILSHTATSLFIIISLLLYTVLDSLFSSSKKETINHIILSIVLLTVFSTSMIYFTRVYSHYYYDLYVIESVAESAPPLLFSIFDSIYIALENPSILTFASLTGIYLLIVCLAYLVGTMRILKRLCVFFGKHSHRIHLLFVYLSLPLFIAYIILTLVSDGIIINEKITRRKSNLLSTL